MPDANGRPCRIQLSRAKGWRKPEGAVVVARPTRFGNPFTITTAIELGYANDKATARAAVVSAFRDWLDGNRAMWASKEGDRARARILDGLAELAGRDLACWCPLDQPCHGHVLLELANKETPDA